MQCVQGGVAVQRHYRQPVDKGAVSQSADFNFLMADDEIMGEDAVQPRENEENADSIEVDEVENGQEDESINQEEFEELNAQLDQLNSALDSLERKNDDIHAELIDLLKSNREAREQFQSQSQKEQSQEPEKPNP